jgi:hypothetical protein
MNLKFTGLTQIWVNSKALMGISSQTAGSTCEFWVNPVNFTLWSTQEHRPAELLANLCEVDER